VTMEIPRAKYPPPTAVTDHWYSCVNVVGKLTAMEK
jgi:hypothetical protein